MRLWESTALTLERLEDNKTQNDAQSTTTITPSKQGKTQSTETSDTSSISSKWRQAALLSNYLPNQRWKPGALNYNKVRGFWKWQDYKRAQTVQRGLVFWKREEVLIEDINHQSTLWRMLTLKRMHLSKGWDVVFPAFCSILRHTELCQDLAFREAKKLTIRMSPGAG